MKVNGNFNIAEQSFKNLRNELVEEISKIDGNSFEMTEWNHQGGGGGIISKIRGSVIEKGGVNISSVSGKFKNEMILENFSKKTLNGYNFCKGNFPTISNFLVNRENLDIRTQVK